MKQKVQIRQTFVQTIEIEGDNHLDACVHVSRLLECGEIKFSEKEMVPVGKPVVTPTYEKQEE